MQIAERPKARKLARRFKVTVEKDFFKITIKISHYYIKQPRTQKAISRLTDFTFNRFHI
jgi:hypothetical protein